MFRLRRFFTFSSSLIFFYIAQKSVRNHPAVAQINRTKCQSGNYLIKDGIQIFWNINYCSMSLLLFFQDIFQSLNSHICICNIKTSCLEAYIYIYINRLLYSGMYNMERYCKSLYCIENPYWTSTIYFHIVHNTV